MKACVAKATQRHEFPDKEKAVASYSHTFAKLLNVSGLEQALRFEAQRDPAFQRNWGIVPECRYAIDDATSTRELIEAVKVRNHGVSDG